MFSFFLVHFHTNHNCESRPDETASPAASASKRSFGNKRKRRVSTGQVSRAWSFGHGTYPLPFPSIDYRNIHLPYVYYHMLSFYHQSQCDYKSWSPPVATDQTVLRNFPGRPGDILSLFAFSLFSICLSFTREEIKRLYRGFKTECPTGILRFFLLTMIRITRHSCQFYKKKIELTVKPLSIDYWHGWMP